jgi:hypothetical protein
MKDHCVELKVCEGCGALFLRAAVQGQGTAQMGLRTTVRTTTGRNATCQGCAFRLSEFPAPRQRRRRGFECRSTRTAVCAGGAR